MYLDLKILIEWRGAATRLRTIQENKMCLLHSAICCATDTYECVISLKYCTVSSVPLPDCPFVVASLFFMLHQNHKGGRGYNLIIVASNKQRSAGYYPVRKNLSHQNLIGRDFCIARVPAKSRFL